MLRLLLPLVSPKSGVARESDSGGRSFNHSSIELHDISALSERDRLKRSSKANRSKLIGTTDYICKLFTEESGKLQLQGVVKYISTSASCTHITLVAIVAISSTMTDFYSFRRELHLRRAGERFESYE
jgi:hypothetical protein